MNNRILLLSFLGLFFASTAWSQSCDCVCEMTVASSTIVGGGVGTATDGDWSCTGTCTSATQATSGDCLIIPDGASLTVTGVTTWGNTADGSGASAVFIYVQSDRDGDGSPGELTIDNRLSLPAGSGLNLEAGATEAESGQLNDGGSPGNNERLNIDGTEVWRCVNGSSATDELCPATGLDTPGYGDTDNNPLPVVLVLFQAKRDEQQVVLSWQTASENGNDYFEIQRSINGVDFESVAKINGAGNSNTLLRYNFIDEEATPSQDYYYRLKQVDNNGNFNLSHVVHIAGLDDLSNSNIYMKRVGQSLEVTTLDTDKVAVAVYNSMGQLVWNDTKAWEGLSAKQNSFNLPIERGFYIIKVITEKGQTSKKIYW